MARVLLVPWGSGNGHIMRMLALARAGRESAHEFTIATDTPSQQDLVTREGFEAVTLGDPWAARVGSWGGWHIEERVAEGVRSDLRLLDQTQPTVVVHDGRPTLAIACWRRGVRCTAVLQSIHLPQHRYAGRGVEEIWTSGNAAFHAVLARMGSSYRMSDLRELISGPPTFIPSFPPFDALGAEVDGSRYIGPLTGVSSPLPARRAGPEPDRDVALYRMVGTPQLLRSAERAFGELAERVHIVTGSAAETAALRNASAGAFAISTLLPADTLSHARVAFTHGGHGITLTMLQLGVPSVVAPGGSPERAENGDRLEHLGAGVVLRDTAPIHSWAAHDAREATVDWRTVRDAVHVVAEEEAYRAAARSLSTELARYDLATEYRRLFMSASVPEL